jgi:hypothetical protein
MVFENDYALIGFWPLNEASGAPKFHNYAPRFANGKVSGISTDMHVTTVDDIFGPARQFPGTFEHLVAESGTVAKGLRLFGNGEAGSSFDDEAKFHLVHGAGGYYQRNALQSSNVAGSGFTVGCWVMPMSNGLDTANISVNSPERAAEQNSIINKSNNTEGFHLGVSGHPNLGAQFDHTTDFADDRLTGYCHVLHSTASLQVQIGTPIESGVFTHLTFVYEYVNGSANNVSLYKNGRLVETRTTSEDLNNPSTDAPNNEALSIVGSQTGNPNNRKPLVCGFGHMISGAYAFERPLSEAELSLMHDTGGLNPGLGEGYIEAEEIELSDSKLISYYPFVSP